VTLVYALIILTGVLGLLLLLAKFCRIQQDEERKDE
jgi:hypothetical protein